MGTPVVTEPLDAESRAWQRLFDEYKIRPEEAAKWRQVECGAGGECFFLSIARATGAPDTKIIRKQAGEAAVPGDFERKESIWSAYVAEEKHLREEEGADTSEGHVWWVPFVSQGKTPSDRLHIFRQLLSEERTESHPLTGKQHKIWGDVDILRLLTRPRGYLGRKKIGVVVFAQSANEAGGYTVLPACVPYIPEDATHIILLYQQLGLHWRALAYDGRFLLPIDDLPKSLTTILKWCGEHSPLAQLGEEEAGELSLDELLRIYGSQLA